MDQIPWPVYLGVVSVAIPLLAVVVLRRRPRGASAWILAWTVMLAAEEAVGMWLARRGMNNHWLRYVTLPVGGALVLWALSLWQTRTLARLTFRLAIPAYLAAWTLLVVVVENTRTFSTAAEPLVSVLGLGAAAFTLVARSLEDASGFARQDWFWTCGGLALYFGSVSMLGPLAALLGNDPALFARAYEVAAAAKVAAYLAIARGITCRVHPAPSGPSSSPPSFRSASSSSR